MSRKTWVLAGLLVVAVGIVRESRLGPSGNLRITFLSVGQGDSALVVTPSGRQILIDAGPDSSAATALKRHMPLLDRSIDLLVMSHGDLDHVGAFPAVLGAYEVGAVLQTDIPGASEVYAEMQRIIAEQKIPVIPPDPAADIDLGDGVTLDIVWPSPGLTAEDIGEEINDASVTLRVLYRDHAILFTGDIGEAAERAILASGADIRADVLKIPHHGSKTSSGTGFLIAINPDMAVVSVAKKNRYGHPNPGVMRRYAALGIPVQTTASGSITMTFE